MSVKNTEYIAILNDNGSTFCIFVCGKQRNNTMKQLQIAFALLAVAAMLTACGGQKKSNDIITDIAVQPISKEPIQMQEYTDQRNIDWIGKTYHIAIHRQPSDSLSMVKDEFGQKYVDNVFSLTVSRSDGSVFFNRTFTKKSLSAYLDDDYRATGIFEGLVFDRADGDDLVFGASVGHPQTDEYIPLVIRLSRMGDLSIKRDTEMDTNSDNPQPEPSSEDI